MNPIDINHFALFQQAAAVLNRESCETNFVNLFAWRQRYDSRFIQTEGRIVVYWRADGCLLFPLGEWFTPAELEARRREISTAAGASLFWADVPQDYLEAYRQPLEEIYRVSDAPDDADYIYLTRDLARLRGVGHRNTRRLMHQFEAAYPDAELLPVSAADGNAIFEFLGKIHEEAALAQQSADESRALCEAMLHFDALALRGYKLCDMLGNMLAFTIFSFLRPDMVNVHFERALRSVYGAAQTIRIGLCRHVQSEARWINLEQDLGIPGLRTSKQSYLPHHQHARHCLHPRGDRDLRATA